ncbi:MAG: hypothetical protein IJU66_09285 [Oscillospiraceae bacterium]|nr:hypothetical protein [Oscillospiraceae bacterium]
MSREEQEQRRRMRREEEERWKKLVTYYLFQKYAKEKAEAEEKYGSNPMPVLMTVLSARGIAARLFEKRPGAMGALDLLAALERFEEPESPMMELLRAMREGPGNEKELNRCVARCITEEPLRLSRRVELEQKSEAAGLAGPEELAERTERLRYELALLRIVMPPELFRELCGVLRERGVQPAPEKELPRAGGREDSEKARERAEKQRVPELVLKPAQDR